MDRGCACYRHLAGAQRADGPLIRALADTVRRQSLYAVIGFGERDPTRPVIYNAAGVFGPEGLIGTTRKMGLGKSGSGPVSGEDMFAHGDAITVYPTRYGPIGVGICYDMWINPEIARIMVLKGAKILVIPTATVATTIGNDIESMAFTRARENMVFVINANLVRGGFEEKDAGDKAKYYNHSYIAGPEFPRMARILGRTDDPFGLVTAEIDLDQYDRFAQRSQLMKKRSADGLNAHMSGIVAREFAALIGKSVS
jgi:predicted amidohydrolase